MAHCGRARGTSGVCGTPRRCLGAFANGCAVTGGALSPSAAAQLPCRFGPRRVSLPGCLPSQQVAAPNRSKTRQLKKWLTKLTELSICISAANICAGMFLGRAITSHLGLFNATVLQRALSSQ